MTLLTSSAPAADRPAGDLCAAAAAAAMDFASVAAAEPETPLSALQPYQPASGPAPMTLEAVVEGSDEPRQTEVPAGAAAGPAAGPAVAAVPSPASLAGPFAAALQVSSPPRGGGSGAEGSGGEGVRGGGAGASGRRAYWEEANPGKALAMLEDELSEVTGEGVSGQDTGAWRPLVQQLRSGSWCANMQTGSRLAPCVCSLAGGLPAHQPSIAAFPLLWCSHLQHREPRRRGLPKASADAGSRVRSHQGQHGPACLRPWRQRRRGRRARQQRQEARACSVPWRRAERAGLPAQARRQRGTAGARA